MNDAVLRSIRHEVWADTRLMGFCAALPPEQLRWTAPGTYGAIHNTLQHIVRAQTSYLFRLTGEDLGRARLDEKTLVGLPELMAVERRVGEVAEQLLAEPFDPTRVIQLMDGTATAGIILAQFIHHGSDHRAHVGTILGANGVTPPDLDVWSYGQAIGEEVVPPG